MVCSHINGVGAICRFNITLFASDYFTGDGINDAVLYTLTNSLTGAGVSKYILPGIGIVLGLTAVFGALAGSCAVVAIIRTILVTACWRSYWRWVRWTPARHFVR